ncbi:MAG: hypothetical protein ACXWB0_06165 [Sulfuricurvum sp.]
MRLLSSSFILTSLLALPLFSMGDEYYAQDRAPVSPSTVQGKTVYAPIAKPVNLTEEIRIQKKDQNVTKLGGAK